MAWYICAPVRDSGHSIMDPAKRLKSESGARSKTSYLEHVKTVLGYCSGPEVDDLLLNIVRNVTAIGEAQAFHDAIRSCRSVVGKAPALAHFSFVLRNQALFATNSATKLKLAVYNLNPNAWAQMAAYYARLGSCAPICQVLALDKGAFSLLAAGVLNEGDGLIPRIAIAIDRGSAGGEYAGDLTEDNTRKLKAFWEALHETVPAVAPPELTPADAKIIAGAASVVKQEPTRVTLARIVEQQPGGGTMNPVILDLGLGRQREHDDFVLQSQAALRFEFGGNIAKITESQQAWRANGGLFTSVDAKMPARVVKATDALCAARDAVSEYFPVKLGACGDVFYKKKPWPAAAASPGTPPWALEWISQNKEAPVPTHDWSALTTDMGVAELEKTMKEWGCAPSFAIVGDESAPMLSTSAFPPPGSEKKLSELAFWTNVPVRLSPTRSQRGLVRVPGVLPGAPGHMFNCRIVTPESLDVARLVEIAQTLSEKLATIKPARPDVGTLCKLLKNWAQTRANTEKLVKSLSTLRPKLVGYLYEYGWELDTLFQFKTLLANGPGTTVVYIDTPGLLQTYINGAAGDQTKQYVSNLLGNRGFPGPITHVTQAAMFPDIDRASRDQSPCTAVAMYRHMVYTREDALGETWKDARELSRCAATLFIALLHKGALVMLPSGGNSRVCNALQESPGIVETIFCNVLGGPNPHQPSALAAIARQMSAAAAGSWPFMSTAEVADLIALYSDAAGHLDADIRQFVRVRLGINKTIEGEHAEKFHRCFKRLKFRRVSKMDEAGKIRRIYERGDMIVSLLSTPMENKMRRLLEIVVDGRILWQHNGPNAQVGAFENALVLMSREYVVAAAHSLDMATLLDELRAPTFSIVTGGTGPEVECVCQAAFTDTAVI